MSPAGPLLTVLRYRMLVGLIMCALYALLWLLVDAGGYFLTIGEVAALPFLPAFVRVAGFLLIGLWIIPALFAAFTLLTITGLMVYPDVDMQTQLLLGIPVALGGPLAMALTTYLARMSTDLVDLRLRHLLLFSLSCAAGNALFYNAGLILAGLGMPDMSLSNAIFVGDLIGTVILLGIALGILQLLSLHPRSVR